MQDQLKAIREHVIEELKSVQDSNALEQLRVRVLGKKGELTAILRGMGKVPAKSSNRPSTKPPPPCARAKRTSACAARPST